MRAMRAKVYTYFRWLREENLRLDLIEMADGLTLAMEGTVLVFNHNAKTWDNRLIEERLGLTSGPTGLQPLPGNNSELKQPDLLHTRLTRQLQGIRERKAGGAGIVPPFKSAKNIVDS